MSSGKSFAFLESRSGPPSTEREAVKTTNSRRSAESQRRREKAYRGQHRQFIDGGNNGPNGTCVPFGRTFGDWVNSLLAGEARRSGLLVSASQALRGLGMRSVCLYNYNALMCRRKESIMVEPSYAIRRTNPRFPFFADAEISLRDGIQLSAQLSEISSRGCYIDALQPVPVGTEMRLCISDGANRCEVVGKVIYKHSGGGLGVFGMGVLFEDMAPGQHSVIETWLRELAGQRLRTAGERTENHSVVSSN